MRRAERETELVGRAPWAKMDSERNSIDSEKLDGLGETQFDGLGEREKPPYIVSRGIQRGSLAQRSRGHDPPPTLLKRGEAMTQRGKALPGLESRGTAGFDAERSQSAQLQRPWDT
jgi:hypothetical protein